LKLFQILEWFLPFLEVYVIYAKPQQCRLTTGDGRRPWPRAIIVSPALPTLLPLSPTTNLPLETPAGPQNGNHSVRLVVCVPGAELRSAHCRVVIGWLWVGYFTGHNQHPRWKATMCHIGLIRPAKSGSKYRGLTFMSKMFFCLPILYPQSTSLTLFIFYKLNIFFCLMS